MAVTLATIAELAQTHASTVSLVLNGRRHDRVSAETRMKIERIAAELGYRVNRRAQGLVRGSTRTIALILNHLSNPFFGKYVSVIESQVEGSGYHVMPFETRASDEREREMLSLHRQGLCDLVISLCHYRTEHDDAMAGDPIVVRMDGWDAGASARCPVPHVVVDYRAALRQLVSSLQKSGRKHLGLVLHQPNCAFAGGSELSAYGKALRAILDKSKLRAGADSQVVAHENEPLQVWHDRALQLLRQQPDIDALLVHTTEFIAPVIEAAKKVGRRIGTDVALAAFDDPPFAGWIEGGVTVLREPIECVGSLLARQALAVLKGKSAEARSTVDAELVERHSTRPELRAGL